MEHCFGQCFAFPDILHTPFHDLRLFFLVLAVVVFLSAKDKFFVALALSSLTVYRWDIGIAQLRVRNKIT